VAAAGYVVRGARVRVLRHDGYRIVVEEVTEEAPAPPPA
jgi:hypothetical protein